MSTPPTDPQRINCRRCSHYFVTWVPDKPHGCRAMGFKSKFEPSLVVFQSSGMPCHLFSPKAAKQ